MRVFAFDYRLTRLYAEEYKRAQVERRCLMTSTALLPKLCYKLRVASLMISTQVKVIPFFIFQIPTMNSTTKNRS